MKNKLIFLLSTILISNLVYSQKPDYYFTKGQISMDSSNFKQAKLYYDSALMKNPKHSSSYFNRGLCERILEENNKAIEDFTYYMTLVPNDGDAFSQRGSAKSSLNDTFGSLRDYDTSLMLLPNNYDTRIDRGLLLGSLDSMELALKDFNYAFKLDSTKFDGVYNIGITLYYLNQNDSAIKYLNYGIQINSFSSISWYYRAKARYYIDDYDNALKDINKAISLDNSDFNYLIARALIYLYNENEFDDELAEDDFNLAIKMGSKEAQKLLDEFFEDDIS